jgi:multiple sugar transport system permease protein
MATVDSTAAGGRLGNARVRRRLRRSAGSATRNVVAWLFLAVMLLPVFYMILVSAQSPVRLEAGHLWPQSWHWGSFVSMWSDVNLASSLRNSLIVAVATGLVTAPVSLAAGYVIARYRFRGRRTFQISLLTAYVFPSVLLLLPLYMVFAVLQQNLNVKLIGGYPALVATYLTLALPFAIWTMSVYVAGLPYEVEEAARIDGASTWQILRRVIAPMSTPGLVVVFIFSFLHSWNDVLFASVMTNNQTKTLGVDMQSFLSDSLGIPAWNELMAASIVSAIPAVILFIIAQRWVVSGLTAGATKA